MEKTTANTPVLMVAEQCANCKWADPLKEDLTKRVCRGAPPQIVVLPMPGGLQIKHHWPMVESKGPICGMYKKKTLDTI